MAGTKVTFRLGFAWKISIKSMCMGACIYVLTPSVVMPIGVLDVHTGAVLIGYIAGKASYQGKCREKILRLENSQLAEAIRHRRRRGTGGPWSET